MRFTRTPATIIVIGLSIAALAACSGPPPTTPGGSEPDAPAVQEINVGVLSPTQSSDYPAIIAEEQGFFDDEGLQVHFLAAANPLPPLFSGEVQIGITGVNGLTAVEQGQDVKFIAALGERIPLALMVRPDSPLVEHANEWPDVMDELAGKTLGVTVPGATIDNVARYVVAQSNQTLDDIDVVAAGDAQALMAGLDTGAYDAALLISPLFERLIDEGQAVSILDLYAGEGPELTIPGATPIVLGSYAEEHPDVIAAYQRAIQEATQWARDPANTEELIAMLANRASVPRESIATSVETWVGTIGDSIDYREDQWDTAVDMLTLNGLLTVDAAYEDYVIRFEPQAD